MFLVLVLIDNKLFFLSIFVIYLLWLVYFIIFIFVKNFNIVIIVWFVDILLIWFVVFVYKENVFVFYIC